VVSKDENSPCSAAALSPWRNSFFRKWKAERGKRSGGVKHFRQQIQDAVRAGFTASALFEAVYAAFGFPLSAFASVAIANPPTNPIMIAVIFPPCVFLEFDLETSL
jgi:hypothetical protein